MNYAFSSFVRRLAGSPQRKVVAVVGAAVIIVTPVLATPPSGFGPPMTLSSNVFGPIHSSAVKPGTWGISVQSQGRTTVGIDKLVVLPGGQSGWHTHAGLVLVSVTSGTLLWTNGGTCQTVTYPAGSSFVEQENNLHLVRNASALVGAEFTAVQLRPEGTPGRIDAAAPTNNCGL